MVKSQNREIKQAFDILHSKALFKKKYGKILKVVDLFVKVN